MADESLVTVDDAMALVEQQAASWFNIRISKNGGLIPSLQLAMAARHHGITCQLGCMVGETSVLSAAGRWFLQLVPDIRFAEGSYGRFLLKDDVVAKPLRFGLGGRWRPMTGPGLGVQVDPESLGRLSVQRPTTIPL
jgi:muconate cycloisomerase